MGVGWPRPRGGPASPLGWPPRAAEPSAVNDDAATPGAGEGSTPTPPLVSRETGPASREALALVIRVSRETTTASPPGVSRETDPAASRFVSRETDAPMNEAV